jgi:single-strand DNA-binding protein
MSATEITVIGNVVTSPDRRRTQNGSVTNFRVAATERRFDSGTQGWVDGATFFVDVECWGELGGNVSHSVSKGDPVVVVGAIRTDEWESDQGKRSRPQIRAEAVAPNLARGVADFRRTQRSAAAAPGEQESPEDVLSEEQSADGQVADASTSEDYGSGSRPLYEVDSEDSSREPAHV